MTNHELLRNQATGVANRPPQWFRRDALAQAQHEFGYVLGKRTRYWPSITTPYRWSGMTNHELLNVRVTGPASVPHCLTQRITEVTRAYRGDGPKRHAWHGLLSPSFCALDPPSPLLFCAAVSSAFGEACRHV